MLHDSLFAELQQRLIISMSVAADMHPYMLLDGIHA